MLTFKVALPELVTVTLCALLVDPTFWPAKVRVAEDKPTAEPVAVPDRATLWGLFAALSVSTKDAVRAPGPVGAKVMVMVQLPPAATVPPQVLVCEKSAAFVPVTVMAEMVNAVVPVLFRVIVWEVPAPPTA